MLIDDIVALKVRDMQIKHLVSPSGMVAAGAAVFTSCPDVRAVYPSRAKSDDTVYDARQLVVGCSRPDCKYCEHDKIASKQFRWSQRLQAWLDDEISKDSTVLFLTLTFPTHLTQGSEPDRDAVKRAWSLFRKRLNNFHKKHNQKPVDAYSWVRFVEHGGRNDRLHLHVIICERDGYTQPELGDRRVMRTMSRSDSPRMLEENLYSYFGGYYRMWKSVLYREKYNSLNDAAWYCEPCRDIERPAKLARYVAGYVSKDMRYPVQSSQGLKLDDKVVAFHKKRYAVPSTGARRWLGFFVQFDRVEFGNEVEYFTEQAELSLSDSANRQFYQSAHDATGALISSISGVCRAFGQNVMEYTETTQGIDRGKDIDVLMPPVRSDRGWIRSVSLIPVMACLSEFPTSNVYQSENIVFSFVPSLADGLKKRFSTITGRANYGKSLIWFPLDDTEGFDMLSTPAYQDLDAWSQDVHLRYSERLKKFERAISDCARSQATNRARKQGYQGLGRTREIYYRRVLAGDRRPMLDWSRLSLIIPGYGPVFSPEVEKNLLEQSEPGRGRETGYRAGFLQTDESLSDSQFDFSEVDNDDRIKRSILIDAFDKVPGSVAKGFDFELMVGQRKAMAHIFNADDMVFNFPTGYGKSLCWQLWADDIYNLFGGITLVVTPIRALLHDQVASLTRRDIRAEFLDGADSRDKKISIIKSCIAGDVRLLYCTPESFRYHYNDLKEIDRAGYRPRWLFRALHGIMDFPTSLKVSHLVVDECHCLPMYSQPTLAGDRLPFRPAYKYLSNEVSKWSHQPEVITGWSATVSPRIFDAFNSLMATGLPDRKFGLMSASLVRENLSLESVSSALESWHNLKDIELPAVVYVSEIDRCEDVAKLMRSRFPDKRVESYFSGHDGKVRKDGTKKYMTDGKRKKIENAFRRGLVDILVATVAFGMGIDKSNIRSIVHDVLPNSVEDYLQQVGRAGRDGQASTCYLLNGQPVRRDVGMSAFYEVSSRDKWSWLQRYFGQ